MTAPGGLPVGQAGRHLQGGSVDAAALFVVKVDHALDGVAGLHEAVVHQNRHGRVVGGVGQPSVNLRDGKASQGGHRPSYGLVQLRAPRTGRPYSSDTRWKSGSGPTFSAVSCSRPLRLGETPSSARRSQYAQHLPVSVFDG